MGAEVVLEDATRLMLRDGPYVAQSAKVWRDVILASGPFMVNLGERRGAFLTQFISSLSLSLQSMHVLLFSSLNQYKTKKKGPEFRPRSIHHHSTSFRRTRWKRLYIHYSLYQPFSPHPPHLCRSRHDHQSKKYGDVSCKKWRERVCIDEFFEE